MKKHESGVNLNWAFAKPSPVHRGPKNELSQGKFVIFTIELLDDLPFGPKPIRTISGVFQIN